MTLRDSLLNFLGEDIVHLILQQMSHSGLGTLSQTSRIDRKFIEPFLYAKIEWSWSKQQSPPVIAFLRTILARPELALYVNSLVLSGDYYDLAPSRRPLPTICVDGLEFHKINEAIYFAGVQYANQWKEAVYRGKMDALIALLLSRLHQLRHLFLGTSITKETEFLGLFFRSCLGGYSHVGFSTFRHLQEVILTFRKDYERHMVGRQTADFLPMFFLPALRSFSVGLDNPEILQWASTAPHASELQSLKLTCIREKPLGSLLAATRALTSLHWEWHYNSDDYHSSNTGVVDFRQFLNALNHVRHSLKRLTICASSIDGYSGLEKPFLEMQGTLKGLNLFSHLGEVSMPWAFMVTFSPDNDVQLVDIIPPQLRNLTITDDLHVHEAVVPGTDSTTYQNEWEDTMQLEVLTQWLRRRTTTHRTVLDLWFRVERSGGEWPADMREELSQQCDAHGVRMKITRDERYD